MHQHADPVITTQRGRRSHRVTKREPPSEAKKASLRLYEEANTEIEHFLQVRRTELPKVSPDVSPVMPRRCFPVQPVPVPSVPRVREEPSFMAIPPRPIALGRVPRGCITREGAIVNGVVDPYDMSEEDYYVPTPIIAPPRARLVDLRRRVEEYLNPICNSEGSAAPPPSSLVVDVSTDPVSSPISTVADIRRNILSRIQGKTATRRYDMMGTRLIPSTSVQVEDSTNSSEIDDESLDTSEEEREICDFDCMCREHDEDE